MLAPLVEGRPEIRSERMKAQRRGITDLDHAAVSLNYSRALHAYEDRRERCGFKRGAGSWFSEGNPKLEKNLLNTLGSSYLPAREALAVGLAQGLTFEDGSPVLKHNACSRHTKECAACCLNTAGRGAFRSIMAARLARALLRIEEPYLAYVLDVYYLRKAVAKYGAGKIARRANVISDYAIEDQYPAAYWAEFAGVIHYDYTKVKPRAFDSVAGGEWIAAGTGKAWPSNYSLTYSASERDTLDSIRSMVASGVNVAVVVAHPVAEAKPSQWFGMPAINGDESDERYLDPRGVVVLLSAKGKAKKVTPSLQGFVKPIA